jgi:hypothetical protein
MADNLPDVVENLANSHESIGDSPIDLDDGDINSEEQNGDSELKSDITAGDDRSSDYRGQDDSLNSTFETGVDKKEPPVTHTDASDVSSNDLSGPEDGECDSEEERGRTEFTKTHYRQSVKLRQTVSYSAPPPIPVPIISDHKADFDLPLEDISPERDTEDLEVQDPYTDFVPPEAQVISPVDTFPPEDSAVEKRKFKKKKEKKEKKRRRDSEGRRSKDEKKRKHSEEEKYVGSPISSGPDNLDNTSPIGDSPISSGEDNWTSTKYPKQLLSKSSEKAYYTQASQSVIQSSQRTLILPKPTPAGTSFTSGQQQSQGSGYSQPQSKLYIAGASASYSSTSVYQSSYSAGQTSLGYQLASSKTYSSSTSYQIPSGQAALNFSVPPPNLSVPPPQTSPRVKPAAGPRTPPSESSVTPAGPRTPPSHRTGKRGPRTPPLSSSKSRGPRTPSSASPSVSRSPSPRGPRTPLASPKKGPRTPPEPPGGPRTPSSSPHSDMSGRYREYDRHSRRRSGSPEESRDSYRSSYVSDYRQS